MFYHKTGDWEYLGTELFDAQNVDGLVFSGKLPVEDAVKLGERALVALEHTMRESSSAAASRELDEFFAKVLASPLFGGLDRPFLSDVIFPFIRNGALEGQQNVRWTNGDFVPRNLLVDSQGNLRLVDCEFAAETHFFVEDFWRWRTYSNLPAGSRDLAQSRERDLKSAWSEAYFLLRQLILMHEVNGSSVAVSEMRRAIERLLILMTDTPAGFHASLFFESLVNRAKGVNGIKTGAIEAELEAQLRSQIVQLNEEVEQRGRWGLSLNAENDKLRGLERKKANELEAGRRDLRTLTVQKDDELRALKMELVELGEQIERRVKEATTFQEMRLRAETMGHAEKLALVAAHEADRLELRRRLIEMELNVARQREASEASEVAVVLVRGENERKHAAIIDLAKRLSAAESEAARLLAAEQEEKSRLAGELQQLGVRLADQRGRYEDQLAAAQDQFAASLTENQQVMARLNSVESEVTWNRAQLERWQQSDHNLRQMQTSWSWRITAPLRKIHQWLGDPLYRRRR
ncbi:MAG: hypothetical protein NTZ29_16270 [Verrucomicrobia bacterium]|nr:hypothetical protein [Verrucomicrobiota bacterium]